MILSSKAASLPNSGKNLSCSVNSKSAASEPFVGHSAEKNNRQDWIFIQESAGQEQHKYLWGCKFIQLVDLAAF